MQEFPPIANTTRYMTKYLMRLVDVNEFVRYMVAPSTREAIQQYFSNYDDNACLSIFAYPNDLHWMLNSRIHEYVDPERPDEKGLEQLDFVNVQFLSNSISDLYAYWLGTNEMRFRFKSGDFNLSRRHKNYLDFEPYTKMQLYLPCVGTIDIDPAAWYGKTIDIYFVIDFENGGITYFAVDEATGIDIGTWEGQYGVEIAVTSTRMGEIRGQAVTGTITGAIQMITGNLAGGASSAANSVMGAFTAPAGVSGGRAGQGISHAFDDALPYIIETYVDPVEDDEAFASVHGMPLYAKRDFSSLAGYTVIDDVHLEGFGTATEGELQEIESLLKSGVHF